MKRVLITLSLVSMFLTGCAATTSGVPVRGKDDEVFRMRGEWVGEYSSSETGRSGTIRFALKGGRRTADGEVTMNLPGGEERQLRIASLRIRGDELIGELERYVDPSCSCSVDTEFVGTMTDGAIDGVFKIRPVGTTRELSGVWHVERLSK
jgi:predicted small secreted protein